MVDLSNSFVALILRMMGVEASRGALATYFDAQFEEISQTADPLVKGSSSSPTFGNLSASGELNPSFQPTVQAKSIALVENSHLVAPLSGAFSLKATQNILNFSADGELNVMVVREVGAPHSQTWGFTISSNFNLFKSKQEAMKIKIQARFDRQLDQLIDLSIDKDAFDMEVYRSVLEHYTQYHTALNPPHSKKAQHWGSSAGL